MSLLSTSYKILFNILLSRLSPYAYNIIGNHQCRFRHNRSTIEHIFCVHQILGKKNSSTMKQCISYSQTSRKPLIQLGGKYCTIPLFWLSTIMTQYLTPSTVKFGDPSVITLIILSHRNIHHLEAADFSQKCSLVMPFITSLKRNSIMA
jgi:hypothetical protein